MDVLKLTFFQNKFCLILDVNEYLDSLWIGHCCPEIDLELIS